MSWGPRARANHHYRKEWGRHVRRQVRAQESAPKSRSTYRAETASVRPGSRPTHDAGPLFVPRPRPETDRDERYAIGARNVFFWTLGALLLSGFLPGPIRLGSLLFPVLVLEAVIWAIYQAQYNASIAVATTPPDFVLTETGFILSEEDARREEDLKLFYADQPREARTLAVESKPAPPKPKAKTAYQDETLEQELRWRQDMKQGKLPQEEVERAAQRSAQREQDIRSQRSHEIERQAMIDTDLRQHEVDQRAAQPICIMLREDRPVAPDTERQIQMLERMVRAGLPGPASDSDEQQGRNARNA